MATTSVLEAQAGPVAKLTVTQGPGAGEVHDFGVGNFRIGRAAEADLSLADSDVSRFHAELMVSLEGAQVRDLESKNGVTVDGRQLASGGQAALAHGSTLALGGVVLELTHHNARVRGVLAEGGYAMYTSTVSRTSTVKPEAPDLRAPALAALCFALLIVALLVFGN